MATPPEGLSRVLSPHPKFQPSDSTDITFRSRDGVPFHLHRRNLETHTGAFPGPEFSVGPGETVDLTEPSEILEIVFGLMYPQKQPDIEEMPFMVVIQVAEAVEKYQVFSAMKAYEFRLKQLIPAHPAEILGHGVKHNYPALVRDSLRKLSRRPLVEVMERLPRQYHLAWCRYHQAWNRVFRETLQYSTTNCHRNFVSFVVSRVLEWEDLDDVTALEDTLDTIMRERPGLTSEQICVRNTANFCLTKIQEVSSYAVF